MSLNINKDEATDKFSGGSFCRRSAGLWDNKEETVSLRATCRFSYRERPFLPITLRGGGTRCLI